MRHGAVHSETWVTSSDLQWPSWRDWSGASASSWPTYDSRLAPCTRITGRHGGTHPETGPVRCSSIAGGGMSLWLKLLYSIAKIKCFLSEHLTIAKDLHAWRHLQRLSSSSEPQHHWSGVGIARLPREIFAQDTGHAASDSARAGGPLQRAGPGRGAVWRDPVTAEPGWFPTHGCCHPVMCRWAGQGPREECLPLGACTADFNRLGRFSAA